MVEDHFPDFFKRADKHSADWQKRHLRSQKLQLGALLVAAAVSAVGGPPVAVVVLFGLALLAQVYRLVTRADEKWWNGRAGAESAKTACWLYVVGGEPFARTSQGADVELATRMTEIAKKVAALVPIPTSQAHVTPEMRRLREEPLQTRIATYQRERIQDQCQWYSTKSTFNEKRARLWSLAAIAAQGLALLLGVVAAAEDWELDFVGLFAALAATVVAWVAVKQYETLARSYAVASGELGTIDVRISGTEWTEDEWAAFANSAEEAISREHTSWRASRAV
jgi:hypothetical protein